MQIKFVLAVAFGQHAQPSFNQASDFLNSSQRAWLLWREAACHVETYESKGGSGFSVYWDQCQIKMNEARAVELQHMMENP